MLKRISIAVGALALGIFAAIFFSGKETSLKLAQPVPAIGAATTISVEAEGPSGVKAFSAAVEQGDGNQIVYEDETASSQTTRIYTFTAGRKLAPFLKEGPA